jgi:Holliday junction resolvase
MTEAEFGRNLTAALRKRGFFVQRIESAVTGRGVPDVFCADKSGTYWLELKTEKWRPHDGMKVHWRPGQQAWMIDYWKATGKPCYTVVKCYDRYLAIPMIKLYEGNKVMMYETRHFFSVGELAEELWRQK